MSSVRHHYLILFLSLAICLFMYIDAYWIPVKPTKETVQNLEAYRSGKRGKSRNYFLLTNQKEYRINGTAYSFLQMDSSVILIKSTLTGSLQFVSADKGEYNYTCGVSYVRHRFGRVFLPIIIAGIAAMFIFFKIIDSIQGRANLCYAIFICTLLALFSHLDFNIF